MLKIKKSVKILAINPGTRYLGIAVFEDDKLVYWAIKSVMSSSTPELLLKIRKIISELVFAFHPDLVVQEKIFYVQCQKSERLKKLSGEIKRLVRRIQLSYLEYTPTAVRRQICRQGKATRKETFLIIASLYPKLRLNSTNDQLWKDRYWGRVLDAIALGLCCWRNLKQK